VAKVKTRFPGKLDKVIEAILDGDRSREIARLCYAEASPYSHAYSKALFALVENILNVLQQGGKRHGRVKTKRSVAG